MIVEMTDERVRATDIVQRIQRYLSTKLEEGQDEAEIEILKKNAATIIGNIITNNDIDEKTIISFSEFLVSIEELM
jgi:uncharacterized protein (UPF0128 family)